MEIAICALLRGHCRSGYQNRQSTARCLCFCFSSLFYPKGTVRRTVCFLGANRRRSDRVNCFFTCLFYFRQKTGACRCLVFRPYRPRSGALVVVCGHRKCLHHRDNLYTRFKKAPDSVHPLYGFGKYRRLHCSKLHDPLQVKSFVPAVVELVDTTRLPFQINKAIIDYECRFRKESGKVS